LKVEAYRAHAPHLTVMADDTGVEIAALQGEPGIHVRRWQNKQTPMSDEAIIAYCIERMQDVPAAQRQARMRTVIALAMPGAPIELFDGILDGTIVETPTLLRYPGFPFESVFYIPAWHKMLGDIHALSSAEKRRQGFLTHRERAVEKALPRLQACLRAAATAAKR
jgi:XTP/dITP diphosphohydrolase